MKVGGPALAAVELITEIPEFYDLFVETRKWAIDNGDENPVQTAIMRVAFEAVLKKSVPSLPDFRKKLASIVALSDAIETTGGKVARASGKFDQKMAAIRKRMEPFSVFEDACEVDATVEGFAKMTTVAARTVEVVSRYFGEGLDFLLNASEDAIRGQCSIAAHTLGTAGSLVKEKVQASLDSLGTHLMSTANEFKLNAAESSDSVVSSSKWLARAQDLEMVGGWAAAAANSLKDQPEPYTGPILISSDKEEAFVKKMMVEKPLLMAPYLATLPAPHKTAPSASDGTIQLDPKPDDTPPAVGRGATVGGMTLGGALAVAFDGGKWKIGEISISLGSTAFLPVVTTATVVYQLVQFYNDLELKRKLAFQPIVPMTDLETQGVRDEMLAKCGLSPFGLSVNQLQRLDALINELDIANQEIANAGRCVTRRKKTSWVGSFVRFAASGGSGTVKNAQKYEKKSREKADNAQGQINSFIANYLEEVKKAKELAEAAMPKPAQAAKPVEPAQAAAPKPLEAAMPNLAEIAKHKQDQLKIEAIRKDFTLYSGQHYGVTTHPDVAALFNKVFQASASVSDIENAIRAYSYDHQTNWSKHKHHALGELIKRWA